MIGALEFLAKGTVNEAQPVYAVVGEDPYLRTEVLAGLVRVLLGDGADGDAFVTRVDGATAALADVLDELRTVPLFARRRVVIVEGADPFVTAHRAELEAYVGRPARSGALVLMARTWPGTTRLAKLVESHGLAIACKAPTERELPAWLIGEARGRWNLKLESEAARLLLELVGPEMAFLASELEKLAVYVGDRKTIGREDVLRLVGAGRVETIWKMLDAATTGDAKTALWDLDRLLTSGEQPVAILAAMSASLRKVHHAGMLRLKRVDAKEACAVAGIPPFALQQTLRQHTHLGPARVARLPEVLLNADMDLKGSSALSPRAVLERLIVLLTLPRRD